MRSRCAHRGAPRSSGSGCPAARSSWDGTEAGLAISLDCAELALGLLLELDELELELDELELDELELTSWSSSCRT